MHILLKYSIQTTTAHTVPARPYLNHQCRNGSKGHSHSQEQSHADVESQRSHVVPKASLRSPMARSITQSKDYSEEAICRTPIEHALHQVDAYLQSNNHGLSDTEARSPSKPQRSSIDRSLQCCRSLVLPSTTHQCVACHPRQGELSPESTADQAAVNTDTAVQTCS